MITVNTTTNLQLLDCDRQFIDLVNNRITIYGQIPYTVPEKLIIDIIKESARFFYQHYYKSSYKTFYHLPKESVLQYLNADWNTPDINDYIVKLPSYIKVVQEIYESSKTGIPTSQQLIQNVQLLQRSAPYGQSILGINNSLYILEAACRMMEEQNYSSIFGTTVPFNYTQLTNQLYIHKTLTYNLMLEVIANVDIQYLYQDGFFIRHVIGRVKQELFRLLGSHTISLPGDATMNPEVITNGTEDVEKVEDLIKAGSGIGDIIMQR